MTNGSLSEIGRRTARRQQTKRCGALHFLQLRRALGPRNGYMLLTLPRQIAPEDLLRALIGIMLALDGPDWRRKATPLMDVFLDGLIVSR